MTPAGVTGNTLTAGGYVTPPGVLSIDPASDEITKIAAWLDSAAPLALGAAPSTPEAGALVEAVTAILLARSAKRRGSKLQAKLAVAVGAALGGLLRPWCKSPPRPVYRRATAGDFTDGPIPYRQFTAAMRGLVEAGLVVTQPGYRRAIDYGSAKKWFGKAARFWPSADLLELVATHGITAGTTADHFVMLPPTKPPTVRTPIVVTSLRQTTGRQTGQGTKERLDSSVLGVELDRLRQEVEEVNELAARHDVRGCLPPRWKRVFTLNASLGGRWIAVGKEGVYQSMAEALRPAQILINNEPVTELDVSACQLSIVHGLLGLSLPTGDLYAIAGYPRDVVKAWITATLGKGSTVTKWSRRDPKAFARNSAYDPKAVGAAICRRYPFMWAPAQHLSGPANLARLAHLGTPEKLLTHRLMNIEAEALTLAMMALRGDWGILALPLHDGLIVQRSAAYEAKDTLRWAFRRIAGVDVRVTADPPLVPREERS